VTFWSPRTHTTDRGGGLLTVTSLSEGLRLTTELWRPLPGFAPWIATWLASYLRRRPDYSLVDDATFFYLVIGYSSSPGPEFGEVDGTSVLEVGIGGDHLGPIDGVGTTAESLVRFAIDTFAAPGQL
jgi:hypothetical protein